MIYKVKELKQMSKNGTYPDNYWRMNLEFMDLLPRQLVSRQEEIREFISKIANENLNYIPLKIPIILSYSDLNSIEAVLSNLKDEQVLSLIENESEEL